MSQAKTSGVIFNISGKLSVIFQNQTGKKFIIVLLDKWCLSKLANMILLLYIKTIEDFEKKWPKIFIYKNRLFLGNTNSLIGTNMF